MIDLVECHSGNEYAERPVAVNWQGSRLEVEALEDQWRTPQGKSFRVRVRDGRRFELAFDELSNNWQVKEI